MTEQEKSATSVFHLTNETILREVLFCLPVSWMQCFELYYDSIEGTKTFNKPHIELNSFIKIQWKKQIKFNRILTKLTHDYYVLHKRQTKTNS